MIQNRKQCLVLRATCNLDSPHYLSSSVTHACTCAYLEEEEEEEDL